MAIGAVGTQIGDDKWLWLVEQRLQLFDVDIDKLN